jgi:indole-3-glycerol phosphate synthase
MSILDQIIARKKEEVADRKAQLPLRKLEPQALEVGPRPSFAQALKSNQGREMRLIAEVKKASPSKGIIAPNFDPIQTAKGYIEHGAHAISVLTDEPFFMGLPKYLQDIAEFSPIPLLRKDFILEEYQILEAKLWGASAFLLIVACLDKETIQRLIQFGHELGLDTLLEVHTHAEMEIARECEAKIIGVNNRDLKTFRTSIETTVELSKLADPEGLLISESGIEDFTQVQMLLECGVSAILVGETLMRKGTPFIPKLLRGN